MQRGSGGGDVGAEVSRSSTADLSSPPSEPERPQSFPSPSQQLSNHEAAQFADSTIQVDYYGGENHTSTPPATATIRHTSNPQSQPPPPPIQAFKDEKPKIKRPRKKPVIADAEKDKKEKAARKPRASSGAGGSARKKAKLENPAATSVVANDAQSKISDYSAPHPSTLTTASSNPAPTNPGNYPIRTHDTSTVDAYATTPHQTPQPTSPAPVSRLSYDPVRSMMVERNPAPRVYSTAPPTTSTPSKAVPLRTSASPATISHIIDAPAKPNPQAQPPGAQAIATEPVNEQATPNEGDASAMEIDSSLSKPTNQTKKPSSGTPSNAPSPKPVRAKEQPPPLPQGSGLLSSALFGNTATEAGISSGQAPNIIVHVKLKDNDNNIINFAQLAEQKYGFAALHPRLAAQKERLARVAAAGAALEKSANGSRLGGTSAGESGEDDVSVDIDRDSDNEGDAAMTGVNGGGTGANSGTDVNGHKKRRRKKVEGYDQDDPFVDDSELAWEAQAAAVKDGFFVYCGPLVPEGEKPAVERYEPMINGTEPEMILTICFSSADGTVKRGRGRGRGGGPGSRGGRGGAAIAAAAVANGEGSSSRNAGPGSRGGTTTRKPRVTKASRAMMEREKHDREKMAPLAAKPSGYPNPG